MEKKEKKVYDTSIIYNNQLVEIIQNPSTGKTSFCQIELGIPAYREKIDSNSSVIYPYPATNDLIKNKVILLPSEATEYGTETDLLTDIRSFVHKYLELSPFFEELVPYYILFTWMYDRFKEVPYLRAIGDYGTGKSRFLKIIGSCCYKPMFTVGAATPAPIFRIISQFKGTLIIDEADIRYSDTSNDLIKILNNGFQSGMPVLRCVGDQNIVKAFHVFGPKVVATRNKFEDKALESRFLIEYMDGKLTRKDIPFNLDETFEEEALQIRNKCLLWRLRNYNKVFDIADLPEGIEARFKQIIGPLCSIISDESAKEKLLEFVKMHNEELRIERGMSFESPILEILMGLMEGNPQVVTINNVTETYNMKYQDQGEKRLSPRKMGSIIRNKFGLKTTRTRDGYVIDKGSYDQTIERIARKYDMTRELVNDVNNSKSALERELEQMGLPT